MWPHRWQPTRLPCPWDSPGKNTGVGCHFLLQCMKVKSEREVAQSCLTLSMDCSLPGSSVHGIFQARVLEWDAIAFSVDWVSLWKIFLYLRLRGKRVGRLSSSYFSQTLKLKREKMEKRLVLCPIRVKKHNCLCLKVYLAIKNGNHGRCRDRSNPA